MPGQAPRLPRAAGLRSAPGRAPSSRRACFLALPPAPGFEAPRARAPRGWRARSADRPRSRNRPCPSAPPQTPGGEGRSLAGPPRRRALRAAPPEAGRGSALLILEAEAEHRLEVVRRELLKGDHRLRLVDVAQACEVLCDHLGQVLMLAYADDRDEVPFACHRVHLGHAVYVRQLSPQVGETLSRRLDQDEGGQHLASSPFMGRWPAGPEGLARCIASPYIHTSISGPGSEWNPRMVPMCVRWSLP